ncbi:MAG: 4a-hydroxytetrahydrobiopterin dehydratase [bacterium]
MTTLTEKECSTLPTDAVPLTSDEMQKLLPQLDPQWEIVDQTKLVRTYTRKDFITAMMFVNIVASIAENENHHPHITINFNIVTIKLSTHAINGLSENDFILAAKIDKADI